MVQTEADFVGTIEKHQNIIHKVCFAYCNSEENRKDLFQEIVLQLWKAYKSFKGDSKFSTWMYRVALNTAISGLRKEKRQLETANIDHQDFIAPEVDHDQNEEIRILYKAIYLLEKTDKAIILLYLEEHSYEDIAAIMGLTTSNVGVRVNRIKKKLKKLMVQMMD